MLQIAVLILICVGFLFINCAIKKNNLLTPQNLFTFGFFLSLSYSVFYIEKMELDMHVNTFFAIAIGIVIFNVVSIISCIIVSYFKDNNSNMVVRTSSFHGKILIDDWKLVIFLCVELLAFISFMLYLFKVAGTRDLSAAMRFWDSTNKFSEITLEKPTLISLLGLATDALTCMQLYLLAHQLIYNYRCNRVLLSINCLIGCVYPLLSGGRVGMIGNAFYLLFMMYFLYKEKHSWKKSVSWKKLLVIIVSAFLVLVFLYVSASLMGRGKQADFGRYICVYLSAELKNLDIFVRKGHFGADFAHSQTLLRLRLYLAKRFEMSAWGTKQDLVFNKVNGFGLGNETTIFYRFLYDGGMPALVIYTGLMAILTQILSELSTRARYYKINFWQIVNVMISFDVFLSFFYNRFYERILNIYFIRELIVMLVAIFFVERFFIGEYDGTSLLGTRSYSGIRFSIQKQYVIKEKNND